MKLFGGTLLLLGVYLGLVHPLFFLVAMTGLLCFLQGIENAIVALTTDSVRRAITENKTYDALVQERYREDAPEKQTPSNT